MNTENKNSNSTKKWTLVNFCEFDKYAIKSYCAIHNVDENLNLGDITKVDEKELEDFDMMTWGFPCTDISVAGNQKGFLDGNGNKTRSGMYYEGIRILRYKKPKFSIIENVKNLTSKRFKKEFDMVLSDLSNAGYNSYWKVLNAKNYGIPQNRERVFIISIRKDLDNGQFKFPEPFDSGLRLKDFLQQNGEVDEKFYLSNEYLQRFNASRELEKYPCGKEYKILGSTVGTGKGTNSRHFVYDANEYISTIDATTYKQPKQIMVDNNNVAICQATKKGYIECNIGGVADLSYPESKTRRWRVQEDGNICPTLTATETGVCKIESPIRIRKLTPRECFRLMGFSDKDFDAAQNVVSNSQLYKQAGNSIVVDVLYYILVELYKAMPYLFDDLKLGSFFSGIGAFEVALDRLYEGINSGNFTIPRVD